MSVAVVVKPVPGLAAAFGEAPGPPLPPGRPPMPWTETMTVLPAATSEALPLAC
jgi:hypothetical protein